jgi:hypothetical protein
MDLAMLKNNFTYHKPWGDQPARYEKIRSLGLALATEINDSVPDSREKSLAFTHLENAVMWANAGIARNEPEDTP